MDACAWRLAAVAICEHITAYRAGVNPSIPTSGPTVDFRVKPDIVAPGTVTSARVGAGSANDCGLTTMAVSAAPAMPLWMHRGWQPKTFRARRPAVHFDFAFWLGGVN